MIDQIDIKDIISIAKDAGNVIMKVYHQDFKVGYKQDNSPLTLADKNANDVIENGLNKLSVSFPILSEEGKKISFEERKDWEYFWLIDPLDGTKEFVSKNGEFTVNIALICKDTPVLGVVYAPALDTCYWAQKDKGAFKDGQKLPLINEDHPSAFKIVVSRSHMSEETQNFIDAIDTNKDKELIEIGSSLKICLVAEGEAHIYPRLGPTMEWDTGAAHSIIIESGKNLQSYKDGKYSKHVYNKKNLLNEWFVVDEKL